MPSTPELDRKLNGSENPKSSGEEDPCIEQSKGQGAGFRDRTEKKLRERTGLSRKGLLIAGIVLLLLLLLLIIVIALGAAWPHIPHHQQYPVCGTAACLRGAAQIREGLNLSSRSCTDIWNWACGGWLEKNPLPRDRSLWNQRQQLKVQEAGRIRDLITTLPLPVHTGTLQWKLKHLYESCMEVDNVDADGIMPLKRIITELEDPLPLGGDEDELYSSYLAIVHYHSPSLLFLSNIPLLAHQHTMRAFVLVAAVVALAQARPEAGYSYQQPSIPSGSYGAPGGGQLGGGGGGLGGGGFGGISGGGLGGGGLGGGFGGGQGGGFGGGQGGGFGGGLGGAGLGGGFGTTGISGGGFGTTGISGGGFGGGGGQGIIQKHVYVHVPPPEPEEFRPQRPIQVAAPQKHYKIIFIKAPAPPTPTVPSIPLQPQNEEKTLVYVLVKRPDEAPEISIPTAAPTQPSKPEVYFIRYKTQKESGGAIGGGAIGGGIGGGSIGGGIGGGIGGIEGGSIGGGISGGGIGGGIGGISGGGIGIGGTTGGGQGPSGSYGPPGQSGPY